MLRRVVDEMKGKEEVVFITTMPNDKSPLIARALRVAWKPIMRNTNVL